MTIDELIQAVEAHATKAQSRVDKANDEGWASEEIAYLEGAAGTWEAALELVQRLKTPAT